MKIKAHRNKRKSHIHLFKVPNFGFLAGKRTSEFMPQIEKLENCKSSKFMINEMS